MMYLKQFPDICREMGFDVEEKAKTINSMKNGKHGFPIRQRYSAILIVMAQSRNALLR